MDERFQYVPVDQIHESPLNPRRHFPEATMAELTESVRTHGIITPLLARPNADGYELAAGHRRLRAARGAGLVEVPLIVRSMDDAKFLEVLTIENLQREDVHPLEEALGYRSLMSQAGYDVATIAAKVDKSESYVYQRLKLAELEDAAQQAFYNGAITAGHAILIARLQPKDQEKALKQCQPTQWQPDQPGCSVRGLSQWIRDNVHLAMARAPFDAAECLHCLKRTSANPALFEDLRGEDLCTDPGCYRKKVDAHLAARRLELADKGDYVQVTTSWTAGKKTDVLPRSQWDEAEPNEKGSDIKQALIVDGPDAGQVIRVRVEQPKPVEAKRDYAAEDKAREEKEKAERAIRGRILDAILAKVTWPLSRQEFQQLVWFAVDGTDRLEPLAERHGYKDARYGEAADGLEASIKKMAEPELARFVLEVLLIDDVEDNFINETPKNLLAAAKRYGVNVAKIRAGEEPAAAPAKKAPAKKAASKKTEAKPAAKKALPAATRKAIADAQKKRWQQHQAQVAKKKGK